MTQQYNRAVIMISGKGNGEGGSRGHLGYTACHRWHHNKLSRFNTCPQRRRRPRLSATRPKEKAVTWYTHGNRQRDRKNENKLYTGGGGVGEGGTHVHGTTTIILTKEVSRHFLSILECQMCVRASVS